MGEWSDYFEDFPDENPANDPLLRRDEPLAPLRERVAREALYSPKLLAQTTEARRLREGKTQ